MSDMLIGLLAVAVVVLILALIRNEVVNTGHMIKVNRERENRR